MSGIGQYVPIDSPVHRLDAAAKIGVAAAFTVALFLVGTFQGLAAMAAAVAVAVAISRVPPRALLRGLSAVGLLMVLTLVVNAFLPVPPVVPLARFGGIVLNGTGLLTGTFFAVRIMLLVTGTSLLTLTTSPVELAGGIERVLAPLTFFRVPVGDIAMTLTIALRFIPTTAAEAENIVTAQQARGAVFDRGGPMKRARAYAPVLIPLFYQLFRRADALATAMEARCYRGSEGRTRLHEVRMRGRDWSVLLVAGILLLTAGWFL